MQLALGIVTLLVGVFFLGGILRGRQTRRSTLDGLVHRAAHAGEIVTGILLVTMFWGTGVFLIVDFSLWWVFLPSCLGAIALWTNYYGRRMKKQALGHLADEGP